MGKTRAGRYNQRMIFSQRWFRAVDGRFTNLVISCTAKQLEATLVYYENNIPKKVLLHTEQTVDTSGATDRQVIYDHTVVALEQLCQAVSRQSQALFRETDLFQDHQQIHEVTLCVGAPWVKKEISNQSKTWSKPTPISREQVDALVPQDIEQGYTRIDTHLSRLAVNGYVINPATAIGQKGTQLDVSVVDMFMRVDLAEMLFQVVHSQFNVSEEQFHILPMTSPLLSFVSQAHAPEGDCVELFSYGYFSDTVVWRKGRLIGAGTVSFGPHHIVDALMESGSVSGRSQAQSIVNLYADGNLDSDNTSLVEQTAETMISAAVQEVANLSDETKTDLPHDWYIYTQGQEARFTRPLYRQTVPGRVVTVQGPKEVGLEIVEGVTEPSVTSKIILDFIIHYKQDQLIR